MSTEYCPNCGKSVPSGAKFCEACGHGLQTAKSDKSIVQQQPPLHQQQPPSYQQQQQPSQYQQQGQYPPPQHQQGGFMNRFQKPPDYIRPPNYVETTTMTQRIIGTAKMNVHVVEEIESRPELQSEAQKLLIVSLAIITIFQTITIFSLPDSYEIHSNTGTIVEVILGNFVGGFVLIYLLASVGNFIGGRETTTSTNEMLRMLSYAYVIWAISGVLNVLGISFDSLFFGLIGSLLLLYTMIVFVFVVRRGLDKGYLTAIATIVISIFIWGFYLNMVGFLVEEVFQETYEYIPPT